jgi:hypothetical protein
MIQRPGTWAIVIKRYYFRHFKVTKKNAPPHREIDAAMLTNCSDWRGLSKRRIKHSSGQRMRCRRSW